MEIPEALSHCFARTLRIETVWGSGSSFVISHRDQQWLVTARHVVEDRLGKPKVFEVLDQSGEKHSGLDQLERISGADVAVFPLWTDAADFGPRLELCSADEIRLMQDVYLVGFPDLGDRTIFHLNYASLTTLFIKRAMVSGEADYYGIGVWLLDGTSTFGFSGGPLIIHERETDRFRVFGVISSYVPANVSVMPPKVCFASAAPGVAPPSSNDSFFQSNSGLAIGFSIMHAVDTIDHWLDRQ
jgi:Trypsin-like peptidase domain